MQNEFIKIIGASENNLKNISVNIPKYKLVALTGVSGSGKSSFAMDILQKECQRQYLESMGMVTDGLNKPKVDNIEGLSPSISVGQRVLSKNPRSTVGTYTEILTYLRILYAKLATRICPNCKGEILPSFDEDEEIDFTDTSCPHCKTKLHHLSMASFSFNKAEGACLKCNGIGTITTADYSKLIDEEKTIAQGAFYLWNSELFAEHYSKSLEKCAKHYGFEFDVTKKVKDYNDLEKLVLFRGIDSDEFKEMFPNIKKPKRVADGNIEGIMNFIDKKIIESATKKLNNPTLNSALTQAKCDECDGTRLGFDGRHAILNNKTITQISKLTMLEMVDFINDTLNTLSDSAKIIANPVITDILKRVNGIIKIGLDYLTIDRPVFTLSGGESQRLRLVSILESGLTGVLYILDEPTTGLHARDTELLLKSIKKLRDLKNTVIVIEHDMDFVKECDYIIDFGVGAGSLGGEIVVQGTPLQIVENKISKTAKYLSDEKIKLNSEKINSEKFIEVKNATVHNLKNVSVKIPLSQLVSFAGVSGSGKSSLVFDVIENYAKGRKAKVEKILGIENVGEIIKIDQSPIGRQSRSNVATYTEVFTLIRELFSNQPQAKKLKLKPADFSFNVKGGRCEKCEGLGVISLDMQFLDDIEVVCPVCKGHRFKKKILSVGYNGKSISDVLNATVLENIEFFKDNKDIIKKLNTINDVGLAYLKLGQSTTTLSGGECQRLKLSKELAKGNNCHTLYLLDEPTTGLHPSDSEKLLALLRRLVSQNNSVFIIEHEINMLSKSDYIIELGPLAGDKGGEIIAKGTPFEISQNKNSLTGEYLKK